MSRKITTPINSPDLWKTVFPWPQQHSHKYDRGHAIIAGGPWVSTGAAKIAAYCALRAGAGLVSVACDAKALPIYAASFQSVMTKLADNLSDFARLIQDERVKTVLIGPGCGLSKRTQSLVLTALKYKKTIVLDADALTVFSKKPSVLFKAVKSPCIMTPHDGEFKKLFGDISSQSNRINQALKAARKSGAVIILKGYNTIVAAPDGRSAINTNATPFLATAGSGDALAGICTGLLAQGMPAFESACAAVWMHSQAASQFGPGLISEDIADLLPNVLCSLYDIFLNNHIIKRVSS